MSTLRRVAVATACFLAAAAPVWVWAQDPVSDDDAATWTRDPIASDSAQGPLGVMLGRDLGHRPVRAAYRFTLFPDASVDGQATDLGYTEHNVSLNVPLWQDSRNELSVSADVRFEDFSTDAVLPDGRLFPDELWDVAIGTAYRHRFDNGWIGGVRVALSSPSDEPFNSWDEISLHAAAFLRVPQGQRDAWLFSLHYSTTREFLPYVPFPGLAYFYNPNPSFQALFGIPLALRYRPTDAVSLEFSYAPITNIRARVAVRPWQATELFVAYAWEHEAYFLVDRPDEDDRFFSYSQRVSVGALFGPFRGIRVEVAGGYAFDRFYFEGENYGDRDKNRIDVDSGPFVTARLDVRF